MEENLEGKRKREEEDSSDDIMIGDLWKKFVAYSTKTQKRILEKCTSTLAPEGKRLIENCELWEGTIVNGYGQIWFNGKMEMVHRAALMIALGVISLPRTKKTGEPLECAHKCDRPLCCKASHLYLATKGQNGMDKSKNGLTKGEKNYRTKITAEVAQEIKWSYGFGTAPERAKEFNVTLSVVSNIDYGASWAFLPDRDGKTAEVKREERNKQLALTRSFAKKIPWTREQLDEAQAKFNNLEYVRIDTEHSYNGTHCRLWIRAIDSGYPKISIGGVNTGAHIVACTIGNNYVRLEDLEAAHKCGQKLCVNSEHLRFATHKENMVDRYEHGTVPFKLSFEQVCDIREQYEYGETQTFLAEAYGVSKPTISDIVNMKIRITK